jgi:hypothetical protein
VMDDLRAIQFILEDCAARKEEIMARLNKIQAQMEEAQKTFAVDSPDGEVDGHTLEEIMEINHIIEDAAAHEDTREIEYQHKMDEEAQKKIFAVDSPDGEVDGHTLEEITEINHIIDDAAAHEDTRKIEYQHKMDEAVRKDRARDPEHDW